MFSFLWLKPGDTRAKVYAPHVKEKRLAISFVTLGELYFWGHKRKWGKKRWDELGSRLRSVIVVPYDQAVCQVYAELKAELSASGYAVENNDLWIAACAVRHSITLITNNRSHFEKIPRLAFVSEAAVVKDIESQKELFDNQSTSSTEQPPDASQPEPAS